MPLDGHAIVEDEVVTFNWDDKAFDKLLEAERKTEAEAKARRQRSAEQRIKARETATWLRQRRELRKAREPIATAKSPTRYVPLRGSPSREAKKALDAIDVLTLLEDLFNDGEKWCRIRLHDGHGRHCILGGLQYIRSQRRAGDDAEVYLHRAIVQFAGRMMFVAGFNDTRAGYAEIRTVIVIARELARRVIDNHVAPLGLSFSEAI